MLDDKAIVFVAQEHAQDGFASVALDTLKVEFYTPTQYEDCMELRRKAPEASQTGMTPMSSPS